jgi:protein-disulfide isomerase
MPNKIEEEKNLEEMRGEISPQNKKTKSSSTKEFFKNPWLYFSVVLLLLIILIFSYDITLDISCAKCDKFFQPSQETTQKTNEEGQISLQDELVKYAKELDLNYKNFDECLASDKYSDEIGKDAEAATASEITGTPGFIVNGYAMSGAFPFEGFKAVIEYELGNKNALKEIENESYYEEIEKTIALGKKNIPETKNDPVLGENNAAVTIVEFTDYQCPFCAQYALNTFPQIKTDYIDTGKVKYAFKDLPLDFHPNASTVAKATHCAREQGKFFEYQDLAFKNQSVWENAQ